MSEREAPEAIDPEALEMMVRVNKYANLKGTKAELTREHARRLSDFRRNNSGSTKKE